MGIELRLCLQKASFAEAIRIEVQYVVGENLQLMSHLSLLHLEAHLFYDFIQFLVDGVVFYRKVVLDKLLHNLAKRQFVDLTVGDEPSNLLPNLLEHSLPVDHLLELIFVIGPSLLVPKANNSIFRLHAVPDLL